MASKHFAVLVILVVGATITTAAPFTYPISDPTDPHIEFLGSFAVDEYDKLGELHLIFKMVFGGYVEYTPLRHGNTYYMDITATNCTQFGAMGNHTAQVLEVYYQGYYYLFQGLKPKQT